MINFLYNVDMLMPLLVILLGLGIVVFALYLKKNDIEFKKKGIPVKLEVINIEEKKKVDKKGNNVGKYYKTTFKFNCGGKEKTQMLVTGRKFKKNKIYDGVYLNNGKNINNLSVGGEGFHLSYGGEFVLMAFGIYIIYIGIAVILKFSMLNIMISCFVFLIVFFGSLNIMSKSKLGKNKKNDIVRKIYYKEIDEDASSTSPTLIRYIPKYNGLKYDGKIKRVSFGTIFGSSIFTLLGLLSSCSGIFLAIELYEIKSWPTVDATITNVYTKTITNIDGETKEFVLVDYKYIVDGNTYYIEEESVSNLNPLKVGDKIKLYYERENPQNSIQTKGIGVRMMPLILGLLFIYLGLFIYMNEKRRIELYNAYIVRGGK